MVVNVNMAFSKLRQNSKPICGYYGDKCVEGWSSCGKCKKIKGKQASRVRKNIDKEFVDIVNNNFWELFE